MLTFTLSLDSLSLYIVAFDVLILLSYVLYLFRRKKSLENALKRISDFISDYFINSGAEVEVTSHKLPDSRHFVVMIQSQPLKRFRYSNILESNLISHTYKKTGCMIDKIYWRFPVQIQSEESLQEVAVKSLEEDLYFNEVQTLSKEQGKYNVSEASWDEFESPKKE
ncbi:MAG: hypothetical protein H0W85_08810 [Methylotenera sp.]|nr:hypothetical protein [Methylotenera sp.]